MYNNNKKIFYFLKNNLCLRQNKYYKKSVFFPYCLNNLSLELVYICHYIIIGCYKI